MPHDVRGDVETLLRHYLIAGDGKDYRAVRELLAASVVTHSPGGVRLEGIELQIAAWTAAHEGLSVLRHEVQEVLASDCAASARVRVSGIHSGTFLGLPPTGARLDVDQALFVRLEMGRIVEMWEIVDTGTALRQLGVLGDQRLAP